MRRQTRSVTCSLTVRFTGESTPSWVTNFFIADIMHSIITSFTLWKSL